MLLGVLDGLNADEPPDSTSTAANPGAPVELRQETTMQDPARRTTVPVEYRGRRKLLEQSNGHSTDVARRAVGLSWLARWWDVS